MCIFDATYLDQEAGKAMPTIAQGSESTLDVASSLSDIWSRILRTDVNVDATSNFFELGGDSIAMLTVLFRVNERFAVELNPADILENPTFGRFCELIESAR